jgi:uncharacterized repeat protein (TIGR03803 family)
MRFRPFANPALLLFALGLATPCVRAESASADSGFRVLHSACKKAGCPDGGTSTGGVILENDGSLLGTGDGGKNGRGVLFRLAPDGHGVDTAYTRLHNFCGGTCKDGAAPDFPLIRDANGNVYGTTTIGGAGDGGTIFEASPDGQVKALHAFCSGDCGTGFSPSSGVTYQAAAAGLSYDGAAPLYGTTSQGGSLNGGTVYTFTRQDGKSRVKTLYNFCSTLPCDAGMLPIGGLTADASGNIFGIANLGGAQGQGAVFELSPAGAKYNYRVIYSFCSQQSCTDGSRPQAGLALDSAGNLYGTTLRLGDHDEGTLFELSPSGGGYSFQVLYQFAGLGDGGAPEASLAIDAAGNLFGTAAQGGDAGNGVVFEFTAGTKTESVLHSFCAQQGCADGADPFSPLTMDANGDLFGSTAAGGASNAGVTFEVKR